MYRTIHKSVQQRIQNAKLIVFFTVMYCLNRWGEGGHEFESRSLEFYRWDMKIT